jgi:hypothetical protein
MAIAFAFHGCVQTAQRPDPPAPLTQQGMEKRIGDRASARMAAVVARDTALVYGFLTPSKRSVVSLQQFQTEFIQTLAVQSYEIEKTTCSADSCIAQVGLTVRMRVPRIGFHPTYMRNMQTWIPVDGELYFVQN